MGVERGSTMTQNRRVRFRMFRGTFTSWQSLLQEAALYASTLPEGALINISHACDENHGVVVVWYWE